MTTEQEPEAAREISAADPVSAGQPVEEPAGAPAPGTAGQATEACARSGGARPRLEASGRSCYGSRFP